jgi:putative ABC transport system ATP-binding protein
LVNRFFDIVSVQKITAKLLLDSLMLGLQTVIGLTVLAFYHPFLLGYDVGLLAMMSIVLWAIGRGAIKTAKDESQLKYETAALVTRNCPAPDNV